MKKILIAALTCAMVVSLTNCDKIKDALSVDIPVNNVKFEFSAPTEVSPSKVATRAELPNSFSVTRKVNISELGSAQLLDYLGKISKVAVNSTSLVITTIPSGNYSVSNLTLKVDGISGSLIVPSYTLGGTFTQPANMNTYTGELFMKLIKTNEVSVTVSGQTDAPVPTIIQVIYESDVIFTAGLLE